MAPQGFLRSLFNANPKSLSCYLGKKKSLQEQEYKEQKIPEGENFHEPPFAPGIFSGYQFVGDQTGKRSDQGPKAAQIDTCKQGLQTIRKSGQQDSGRNVADDLACQYACQQFSSLYCGYQSLADQRDSFHVSHKDKEKEKSKKKKIIHLQIEPAVQDQNGGGYAQENRDIGQDAKYYQERDKQEKKKRKDIKEHFSAVDFCADSCLYFHHRFVLSRGDGCHKKYKRQSCIGQDCDGKLADCKAGDGI